MTTTTNTTLAARAAVLLSKSAAYGVVEKALEQALAAKRVYPALATDFGEQLGHDLPLKTRDFVKVVGNLLASSEKPIKGVISRKKSEILNVLSDIVSALTDTQPIALPSWAFPKERTKKAEAETEVVIADGALQRANEAAEALASAAMAEAKDSNALAKAVAVVVAHAGELTDDQREALMMALQSTELAPM